MYSYEHLVEIIGRRLHEHGLARVWRIPQLQGFRQTLAITGLQFDHSPASMRSPAQGQPVPTIRDFVDC
jgi:hypothetical protein